MATAPAAVPAPELTIWTDAAAVPTVAGILEALGPVIQPLAVAGPRTQPVTDLAQRLDRPREDDLRTLLVQYPAAFLLLGTAAGVSVDHLATAADQNTRVITLEPVADDLPGLAALTQPRPRKSAATATSGAASAYDHVVHVPAFTAAPGYLAAAEPHESLGPRRTISLQSVGQRGQGSLFARLFDAWRTVLTLAPMPLTIDAALTTGHAHLPESLRHATGSLTAHARLPEAGAILIDVADHAGSPHRHLHALGDHGELRITDAGYTLHHTAGQLLDRGNPYTRLPFPELVAHQWRGLLTAADSDGPQASHRASATAQAGHRHDAHALACCLACLLSARTAAPEDPRRLLEIHA
ncbi:MAG: hypothetical protein WD009_07355 [Phycisphaeraceae bacterium]